MFQRAKVQKFESQSQLSVFSFFIGLQCFKEQKYKNLKANHNQSTLLLFYLIMFQRAKVQKFESQSQPSKHFTAVAAKCFKEQKYKNLKANHNVPQFLIYWIVNVSKSKSTKI